MIARTISCILITIVEPITSVNTCACLVQYNPITQLLVHAIAIVEQIPGVIGPLESYTKALILQPEVSSHYSKQLKRCTKSVPQRGNEAIRKKCPQPR